MTLRGADMAERMDITIAVGWIAYAAGRRSHDEIRDLGMTDEQLVTLGQWFAANPIISPYARRKAELKHGVFKCRCGCGERFEATWKTRRPSYKNHAHRQRAYIKQQKQNLAAESSDWIPEFK
jgi:hypothetical protein